jgi:hypothetical protein
MLRGHARIMLARGLLTPEQAEAANVEPLVFRPRRGPLSGALTLEVDPLLDDEQAVARALAIPVPAGVAPVAGAGADDRAVVTASPRDDRADDEERDPGAAPSDEEPELGFTRAGLRRPSVRIH